jgi:hypothetical protein
MPVGRLHLSPRIGAVWDVFGTGRDRIRGGVGIFTGRPPLAWLQSPLRRYGVGTGLLECGSGPTDLGPAPAFEGDYRSPPTACADGAGLTAPPPGDVDLLDPDLRMARALRGAIAYERRLPWGLVAAVEGLFTRNLSDFLFVNRNLLGPQGADRNGRAMYGAILPGGNAVPALRSDSFASVVELTNTDRNHSYQLTARLDRQFSEGVAVTGSYTFSRVRDVQTPQRVGVAGQVNWSTGRPVSGLHEERRTGVSVNEIPHRIVLAGTYRTPASRWATEVALFYVGEAGRPFTYVASGTDPKGDLNADGSNVNDPIYVPLDAYDTNEIRFGGPEERVTAQQAGLEAFIEGTPCLDEQRGTIMERNSCRSPWTHTTIASVRQWIPVGGRRFEAQIDLYNVLNLLDPGWGLVRVPATGWTRWNGSPALLRHVDQTPGPADTARSIFQFNETAARWQILQPESAFQVQVALRYQF